MPWWGSKEEKKEEEKKEEEKKKEEEEDDKEFSKKESEKMKSFFQEAEEEGDKKKEEEEEEPPTDAEMTLEEMLTQKKLPVKMLSLRQDHTEFVRNVDVHTFEGGLTFIITCGFDKKLGFYLFINDELDRMNEVKNPDGQKWTAACIYKHTAHPRFLAAGDISGTLFIISMTTFTILQTLKNDIVNRIVDIDISGSGNLIAACFETGSAKDQPGRVHFWKKVALMSKTSQFIVGGNSSTSNKSSSNTAAGGEESSGSGSLTAEKQQQQQHAHTKEDEGVPEFEASHRVDSHKQIVNMVKFVPCTAFPEAENGGCVVTCSQDSTICFTDGISGQVVKRLEGVHGKSWIRNLVFNDGGKSVVSTSDLKDVICTEIEGSKKKWEVAVSHSVFGLDINHGETLVAAGTFDTQFDLISIAEHGKEPRIISHLDAAEFGKWGKKAVFAIRFIDASRILSANADGSIVVFQPHLTDLRWKARKPILLCEYKGKGSMHNLFSEIWACKIIVSTFIKWI